MFDEKLKNVIEDINAANLFEDKIPTDIPEDEAEDELRETAAELKSDDENSSISKETWEYLVDNEMIEWMPSCLDDTEPKETEAKQEQKKEEPVTESTEKAPESDGEGKAIVDTGKFQKALKTALLATSTKSLFPAADCVGLFPDGIKAFDGRAGIHTKIQLPNINALVNAKQLDKLVSGIKNDTLTISQDDGELSIKAGKFKAGVPLSTMELAFPEIPDAEAKNLPDEFLNTCKEAQAYCQKDDTGDSLLTCIHVKGDTVIGTDGKQLYKGVMEDSIDADLCLPPEFLKIIHGAKAMSYVEDDNRLVVYGEEATGFLPKLNGNYPDTDKVVNMQMEAEGEATFDMPDSEIVKRIMAVKSADSDALQFKITENAVEIEMCTPGGWTKERYDSDNELAEGEHEFCLQIGLFGTMSQLGFETCKATGNAVVCMDDRKFVTIAKLREG